VKRRSFANRHFSRSPPLGAAPRNSALIRAPVFGSRSKLMTKPVRLASLASKTACFPSCHQGQSLAHETQQRMSSTKFRGKRRVLDHGRLSDARIHWLTRPRKNL